MTVRCSYEGTVSFKFNEKDYEATVRAKADYFHQPCVMYFKDGTGQPEDEEFDIDEVEIIKVYCIDDDADVTERYDTDKDFKCDVDCLVEDVLYEMDYDEWTFPEDEAELEHDYEIDFREEQRHFGFK